MNIPSTRWLMPAALLLWATLAQAQASPVPPAAPASGPATTSATTSLSYRSAIQSYKPWAEMPVASWRAVNDTTAQVGGWRVYAREAQQPDEPVKDATGSQTPTRPSPGGRQGERP